MDLSKLGINALKTMWSKLSRSFSVATVFLGKRRGVERQDIHCATGVTSTAGEESESESFHQHFTFQSMSRAFKISSTPLLCNK